MTHLNPRIKGDHNEFSPVHDPWFSIDPPDAAGSSSSRLTDCYNKNHWSLELPASIRHPPLWTLLFFHRLCSCLCELFYFLSKVWLPYSFSLIQYRGELWEMQKSITSFFKKASPVDGGIRKPSKRTSALSPVAVQELKKTTLSPDVQARIEANRAAALVKRLSKSPLDLTSKKGFGSALEPSWREALAATLQEKFFDGLVTFIATERKAATIYPPPELVFSAFNHSTFSRTRVVIIGQDPYHGPRQAHGMSFSVPEGVYPPPSLINIFQELETDFPGFVRPKSGCLEKWANQGVLLLNAVLTVRRAQPCSHQNRGWERFTDSVVQTLNKREGPGCVFMLWGGYAKRKGAGINRKKHCVLTSVHPSPLSANRGGWFGNKHFSKANEFLIKTKQDPIDWKLWHLLNAFYIYNDHPSLSCNILPCLAISIEVPLQHWLSC